MNHWTAYPFLRITIVWIIGIVAGTNWFMGGHVVLISIVALFLFFVASNILLSKSHFYQWNSLHGITLLLLLTIAGAYHGSRYDQALDKSNLVQFDTVDWYSGIIHEGTQETAKFNRTQVKLRSVNTNGQWKMASGKVLLYYPKDLLLRYGDEVLIKGDPDHIPPPSNPYEFDYRQYLKRQNIFHQHFAREEHQILVIDHDKGSGFYSMILRVRNHATKLIKTHIQGKDEQAVALALIMGVKDELDNELTRAYGISGAMHVLAVSGLHVGIVYGFLFMVFGTIKKGRYGRIVFAVINLSALWMYALLTGFAPSTLRATIMFSAIIISQAFKRQTSIYNSIFFSAFIILLYNPFMIFTVGFQLSFLAVLGIVYLTPKIYRLLDFNHWLMDKMWMLICVSVAAQMATFPLTILYFNQFSIYFWAVNLLVIPAAFVILISGIVFLAVGGWEILGSLVGKIVELAILGMNKVVFAVEGIPGSAIYPLNISTGQTFLFFFIMLSFIAFLHFKKIGYLALSCVFVIIFAFMDIDQSLRDSDQQKIMVYCLPGHTAIDFVDGIRSYLYADSLLVSDKNQIGYSIVPFHVEHNLSHKFLNTLPLAIDHSEVCFDAIVFKEKTIIYIKNPLNDLGFERKIKTDFLIIGNNSIKDLDVLSNKFEADQIIIDGANARWLASRLYQQSRELKLKCFSLLDQGGQLFEL